MSELVAMTELTDTELDAVCGGALDFGNVITQINTGLNLNINVLSFGTSAEQGISQGNAGLVGSLFSLG
jgi:hypothetical protein